MYYFGKYSSELAELVPLSYSRERGLLVILIDCIIFLFGLLDVIRVFVDSFFPSTVRNSMLANCFPLTYNLNRHNYL